ncbi:MAG: c-type cytochrome [Acidobacteriota bacterium]
MRSRRLLPGLLMSAVLGWLPVGVTAQAGGAADAGAKVYATQKCALCHSVAGQGNKKLPLDGVGSKLNVDQIREWLMTPVEAAKKVSSTVKPPMPSYAKLTQADLDALVAYMRALAN